MGQVLWILLPLDMWSHISQFLSEIDTINLFWILWKESLITQTNIVTGYKEFF